MQGERRSAGLELSILVPLDLGGGHSERLVEMHVDKIRHCSHSKIDWGKFGRWLHIPLTCRLDCPMEKNPESPPTLKQVADRRFWCTSRTRTAFHLICSKQKFAVASFCRFTITNPPQCPFSSPSRGRPRRPNSTSNRQGKARRHGGKTSTSPKLSRASTPSTTKSSEGKRETVCLRPVA